MTTEADGQWPRFIEHKGPPAPADEDARLRWGWLGYRPDYLQRFNTPKGLLTCLSLATIIMGMAPIGFVSVCITTIERRYHYKSRDTGIIVGATNAAFLFFCVPASYLASRPHASKPRWLGWGMVIMGIGSLVYAMPHFMSTDYDVGNGRQNKSAITCSSAEASFEGIPNLEDPEGNWHHNFLYVFILGQFLHGIGSTPLFVLGTVFIDESVPRAVSSFYVGVYSAMTVGGAALGFIAGSSILKIYIDWPYVDPALAGLTPESDLWLGCWWLCFLLSGCVSMLVAVPLLAFPRKLPPSDDEILNEYPDCAARTNEHSANVLIIGQQTSIFSEIRRVFCNVSFMSLAFAEGSLSFLGSGMSAFMPKLVENQFNLPASYAALIIGAAGVPSGCLGSVFGGWFLKKFDVGCTGALKACFICHAFLMISNLGFLIHCDNSDFAGIQLQYENISSPPLLPNLLSSCNSDCGCDGVSYNPVCGANGIIYYSPCHAGCTENRQFDNKEMFTNCSCIPLLDPQFISRESTLSIPGIPPNLPDNYKRSSLDVSVRDRCKIDCNMLPLFIAAFVIIIFVTFVTGVPSLTAGLRCIDEDVRAVGFGVRSQICRVLGQIPGPIIFGIFIDKTCLLWENGTGSMGSCAVYEHASLSRSVLYIFLLVRAIGVVLYGISWWSYNPSLQLEQESHKVIIERASTQRAIVQQ